MYEHGEGVRHLVADVLGHAIFEARHKGCRKAWGWLASDKAVLWAGYLGISRGRWLDETRKMEPSGERKKAKPPTQKPTLPDTPLVRALVRIANREPLPQRKP